MNNRLLQRAPQLFENLKMTRGPHLAGDSNANSESGRPHNLINERQRTEHSSRGVHMPGTRAETSTAHDGNLWQNMTQAWQAPAAKRSHPHAAKHQ